MTVFIKIIKFLGWYILTSIIFGVINTVFMCIKHRNGKHFCNDCEIAFTQNKEYTEFEYCPYCGKPLEYMKYD